MEEKRKLMMITDDAMRSGAKLLKEARSIWINSMDSEEITKFAKEKLAEIESGELTWEKIKEVYDKFNEEYHESEFELVEESENSVVVRWPEDDNWTVEFTLI